MPKNKMGVLPTRPPVTARLGAGTGASHNLADTELYKFVKLVGDSQFALASVGDKIEGQIVSIEPGTAEGYTAGSVKLSGRINAICDGLQATAGTGTVAVGNYVVVGTVTAKGTALSGTIPAPKVCVATNQPGATVTSADNVVGNINAAIAKVTDAQLNAVFAWRVVSLGNAGAVGDTCVIERVSQI